MISNVTLFYNSEHINYHSICLYFPVILLILLSGSKFDLVLFDLLSAFTLV